MTPEARKIYNKNYRQKNKEKIKAKRKEYVRTHRKQIREDRKRYRIRHRERILARRRELYKINREKATTLKRKHRKKNSDSTFGSLTTTQLKIRIKKLLPIFREQKIKKLKGRKLGKWQRITTRPGHPKTGRNTLQLIS